MKTEQIVAEQIRCYEWMRNTKQSTLTKSDQGLFNLQQGEMLDQLGASAKSGEISVDEIYPRYCQWFMDKWEDKMEQGRLHPRNQAPRLAIHNHGLGSPYSDRFEETQFSILNAIRAQVPELAREYDCGLAIEQSQELQRRSGRTAAGLMIPYNALSAGTAADGGDLVATELRAMSFIDVLRSRSVVMEAGATFMSDLVGNVDIPRKTSPSAPAWLASEDAVTTESDPQFDQVSLRPKDIGVHTQITRRLAQQSTPDAEAIVRNDLLSSIATGIDNAALNGDGTAGSPTGVVNQSGINTVTFAATAPTWAEVVQLETEVNTDNALQGSTAYLVDANGLAAAKTTERATDTGLFIFDNGSINSHQALVSNNVAANNWMFGNWADLLIGQWNGALDLIVDPYTESKRGRIIITAISTIDVAVRHPESFCLGST